MFITAIIIPVVLFSLWVLSGYLPTRNIAMPTYTVVARKDGYEIRTYDPYIIAEAPQAAGPGPSGFKRLFEYITGNNTGGSKLPMTAPVLKSGAEAGQKIAMTAPVLKKEGGAGTIAFVMPPRSRIEELPQPKDPALSLREIPGHRVAVVTFSGSADRAIIAEKTERLLHALRQDGIQVLSPPVTALYNPPWTPPFMRRNEIMVEVASPAPNAP
ncbi:MAG TPA: heme-binding protein [Geobacteraceae bacterium]|nr:heme-binding protein [Geobacteraceae bacterium]